MDVILRKSFGFIFYQEKICVRNIQGYIKDFIDTYVANSSQLSDDCIALN